MYGITIARCMVNNSQMYGKTIARCMVSISQMYSKTIARCMVKQQDTRIFIFNRQMYGRTWPVNTCICLASTLVAAICSEVSVCMQQDTLLHPREQKPSALIRLLGCASWFEPSLFECNKMKFLGTTYTYKTHIVIFLTIFLRQIVFVFPNFIIKLSIFLRFYRLCGCNTTVLSRLANVFFSKAPILAF